MGNILQQLRHGIVVSVQATHGEPLNTPEILNALAESALDGGACAVRMAQTDNIRYFKARHPKVPVIGITKPLIIPPNAYEMVYITPTWQDVQSLATCCDIVALDATLRPRPNGERLENIISLAREKYPNLLLMADIATLEEGINADKLGFDLIGTTLSGYTTETRNNAPSGPNFELLNALRQVVSAPVVMEGRIWEPSDVKKAFEFGAYTVVIGSAVTRPHEIIRRFVQAVPSAPAQKANSPAGTSPDHR